jgi:cardiolipin synthase
MPLHWLPNAISVCRILIVAPVTWLIVAGDYASALLLFFVAGFSDALDGFLAKTFNWHSRLGALLDPAADKLLLTGSFAALWLAALVPAWLALLVILRDVVIVAGATFYNFLIRPVEGTPTAISKVNTALELAFVLAVLATAAYGWPGETLSTWLGAAVFVTVIVSGIDYVWTWSVKAARGTRHRHD